MAHCDKHNREFVPHIVAHDPFGGNTIKNACPTCEDEKEREKNEKRMWGNIEIAMSPALNL
ncbi:MAG: hypothetical protein V1885_03070 [Candidatus Brennerbacteria bacterium]